MLYDWIWRLNLNLKDDNFYLHLRILFCVHECPRPSNVRCLTVTNKRWKYCDWYLNDSHESRWKGCDWCRLYDFSTWWCCARCLCHLHQRCRRSTVPVSTVSHLNSLVRDVATFWCYRPPFPSVAVGSWRSCCSWVFLWCAELLCNPHVSWLLVDHKLWNTELGISTTWTVAVVDDSGEI